LIVFGKRAQLAIGTFQFRWIASGAAAILLLGVSASPQLQNPLTLGRHWSGQGIDPVYEGYDTNPDGSFNMWFG